MKTRINDSALNAGPIEGTSETLYKIVEVEGCYGSVGINPGNREVDSKYHGVYGFIGTWKQCQDLVGSMFMGGIVEDLPNTSPKKAKHYGIWVEAPTKRELFIAQFSHYVETCVKESRKEDAYEALKRMKSLPIGYRFYAIKDTPTYGERLYDEFPEGGVITDHDRWVSNHYQVNWAIMATCYKPVCEYKYSKFWKREKPEYKLNRDAIFIYGSFFWNNRKGNK